MRAIHLFTVHSFIPASTLALPVGTMAMSVTVGHFALIVPKVALLSFPAGVALALSVDVVASLGAQDGTYACKGVRMLVINLRSN
jgi:hypothetical protein